MIKKVREGKYVCWSGLYMMIGIVLLALLYMRSFAAGGTGYTYYNCYTGGTSTCGYYTIIGEGTYEMSDGNWYVLKTDVTALGGIKTNGNVNIILGDGNTWTMGSDKQIVIESGSVTFWGQSAQTGTLNMAHSTNQRGAIVTKGNTVNFNGGNIKLESGWNQDAALYGEGTCYINAGTVNIKGTNSHAVQANIVMNGGTLTATNGTGTTDKNTIQNNFTFNGGTAIISSPVSSSYFAFSKMPKMAPQTKVKVGQTESTLTDVLYKDIDQTLFTDRKCVELSSCTAHEIEAGECKYCGVKMVSQIDITDIDDPISGHLLDNTAEYNMEGKQDSVSVTWNDADGKLATAAKAKVYYTAYITVELPDNMIFNPGGVITTINAQVVDKEIADDKRSITIYTPFPQTEKYEIELGFKPYDISYPIVQKNVEIVVDKVIDGGEVEVSEDAILSAEPIKLTTDKPAIAEIDATTHILKFKKVGTFHIIAEMEGGATYEEAFLTSEEISVVPADISELVEIVAVGGSEKEYDGKSWKPQFTVDLDAQVLEEGVDYKVTYPSDTKNVGEKLFKISFQGNYKGSKTINGTISPKDVSNLAVVTFVDKPIHEYNGRSWNPKFIIMVGENKLVEGEDYEVSYPKDSINASTKEFVIDFTGNYTGSIKQEGSIEKKDISNSVSISFADKDKVEYSGKSWKPKFKVVLGDKELTEDKDYTIIYPEDMVSAGEKKINFRFKGNYTGEKDITGNITEKNFEMPETPFTIEGKKGLRDYYVSTVTVTAAKGYYISKKAKGDFKEKLSFEETFSEMSVYLQDKNSGEVSKALTLHGMKIDKLMPIIIGASNGVVLYGETSEIEVSDKNLRSVLLNGEEQILDETKCSLSLSANKGMMEYILQVEDEAGNRQQIRFQVAEEWTKSGIVPSSRVIRLTTNNSYQFASGNWKLQGDNTTYTGGKAFYVNSEGEYTFEQQ